jgi:transposase
MRLTKFARILIGINSLFVVGVRIEGFCIIATVKPTSPKARCPKCGRCRPGYDRREEPRRWVHLSIGSFTFILEYAPRRVDCPTCGVLVEKVPWARHDCRFTRDFEEMVAYLAQTTDKTSVCKLMGISWSTVGNVVARVVADKLDPHRLDELRKIGVDEFSYRKRHRYITVVVDHGQQRVIWAGVGKGEEALNGFFRELGKERAEKLEVVTMDMSAAYIKSVQNNADKAQIVFDRFHVQKLAGDAVDEVRRELSSKYRALGDSDAAQVIKSSRFSLLRRNFNASASDKQKLADIERHNKPLYRAYLLKETLADVFEKTTVDEARAALDAWLAWASRSKLAPFARVARTIRKFKDRILAYIESRLSNGIVEGFNNKLRMIANRAFGFHSAEALIASLFLCCSGIVLEPKLPRPWCPW